MFFLILICIFAECYSFLVYFMAIMGECIIDFMYLVNTNINF